MSADFNEACMKEEILFYQILGIKLKIFYALSWYNGYYTTVRSWDAHELTMKAVGLGQVVSGSDK